MTSQRYEVVEKDLNQYYSPRCPVVLTAYAILYDTLERKYGVQLKLKNCSFKKIKSIVVAIRAYDHFGNLSEEIKDCQYVNVNVEYGKDFGTKVFVPLSKDTLIKNIRVVTNRILFDEGDVWDSKEGEILDCKIEYQQLSSLLLEEDIGDYRILLNTRMKYVPYQNNLIWICSCGAVNFDTKNCHVCKAEKDKVFDFLRKGERIKALEKRKKERNEKEYKLALSYKEKKDADSILKAISIFEKLGEYKDSTEKLTECRQLLEEIHREDEKQAELLIKEQAEKEKRRAQKRKKTIKILRTVSIIVGIGVMLVFILTKVVLPQVKYKEAEKYMETGQYQEAANTFNELDNYKDSKKKAEEAETKYLYNKANDYYEKKDYEKAYSIYNELGEYEDSKDYAVECRYQMALDLLAKGKDDDAYSAFQEIEAYKDVGVFLKDFVPVPNSIEIKSNDTRIAVEDEIIFTINYNKQGKIVSANYIIHGKYESKEMEESEMIYYFDEEGNVSKCALNGYWHSSYDYNDDGTVNQIDENSGKISCEYDKYGNPINRYVYYDHENHIVGRYGEECDEYHNRIGYFIDNKYNNGQLVEVDSEYDGCTVQSKISYQQIYDPDNCIDNEYIWKNVRIICFPFFYN